MNKSRPPGQAEKSSQLAQRSKVRFDAAAPTVLITGANRGLGLEFARQYAALGWNVIATCREPELAAELLAIKALHPQVSIDQLDITRDDQVADLARLYAGMPVDVLLNNAGIYGTLAEQSLASFNFEELKRVFDINTIGALRVSQAFIDNVLASEQKKIISLGGGMGTQSIGSAFGGHYFMKMSKAAHLMAMGILQTETREQGIVVVMVSPGRVDTRLMRDSGWTGAALSPTESARRVIARIAALEPAMHGRLVTCDGQIVPW